MKNYYYLSPSPDGWQNLAADEWLLDHLQPDEMILYFYINQNAVIIGKNQNPWRECNLQAMEDDGVQLVRRITGGGAVYHDAGNLNFSFIAGEDRYDLDKQMSLILESVRSMGIPCEFSGRNDLLADGKKFSGNAFCSRGKMRQHHGTLLIGANLSKLQNYLQVDPRKLQAKGVESVRSRVCNLSDFQQNLSVPVAISSLKRTFRRMYGDYTEWQPSNTDMAGIAEYYAKHSSWQWRIGQTPQFDLELDHRFDWGGVQLLLTTNEGIVSKAEVYSDALDAELPGVVAGLLTGCQFQSRAMFDALRFVDNPQVQDIAAFVLEQKL